MPPLVTIIAAMSENRVIGRGGGLPWHLPDDMRRFQTRTTGHMVIMGRRTFESMKPLPRRRVVVVSRRPHYHAHGAQVAAGLDEALALAADGEEVFIAGGSAVYALALPRADRLDLTIVHARVDGDTLFPEFDPSDWTLVGEEHHPADERHRFAFSFVQYERRDGVREADSIP